jgi:hypothetical protein
MKPVTCASVLCVKIFRDEHLIILGGEVKGKVVPVHQVMKVYWGLEE